MFQLNYPLNIQVEVTEACNHRCVHCYNFWRPDEHRARTMSSEDADKLVEIIIRDIRPFHVTITGGEPMLKPETTARLIKGLKRNGRFSNVNTNLVLLGEEELDSLIESAETDKFGILTSLPHDKPDIYEKITGRPNVSLFFRSLDNVLRRGLPITVNMVVNSINRGQVYGVGKCVHEEHGIKNFAATPVLIPAYDNGGTDLGLSNEEVIRVLEDLVRLYEDTGMNVDSLETIPLCLIPDHLRNNSLGIFNRACSAGRSTVSIGPDGEVRPCSHAPMSGGNVFRQGFSEIWAGFKDYRDNLFAPDECHECAEFYGCYGGCRMYAFDPEKGLKEKDPRMVGKKLHRLERKRQVPETELSKEYRLNPNTVWREEQNGLYVLFNGNFQNVLFVNPDFLGVVEHLKGRSVRANDLGETSAAKNLFGVLVANKYLI